MHVELWRLGWCVVGLWIRPWSAHRPSRFRLRSRLSLVFSVLSKSVHDRLMGSKIKAQMRFQTRARCDAKKGNAQGARSKEVKQRRGRAGRLGGRAGWQGRERTVWWSGGGRFGVVISRFFLPCRRIWPCTRSETKLRTEPVANRLQLASITLEKTITCITC